MGLGTAKETAYPGTGMEAEITSEETLETLTQLLKALTGQIEDLKARLSILKTMLDGLISH